jgi:hypothetical protein
VNNLWAIASTTPFYSVQVRISQHDREWLLFIVQASDLLDMGLQLQLHLITAASTGCAISNWWPAVAVASYPALPVKRAAATL